jgi:hypothetical protein
MAIPFFAGMVRFRGMSSRAFRLLPDNDQGLLAERTTAYRPLRGRCGCPRALPVSPGAKGVGVAEALGQGVSELTVGTRVLFMDCWNLWRERVVSRADSLVALPDENLSCRQIRCSKKGSPAILNLAS